MTDQTCTAAPDPTTPQGKVLKALEDWYHFQSSYNVNTLYNACAEYFGSDFNPAEYDNVE